MGLYTRGSLDLLGQLIKRDNPGFKGEINKSTVLVLGGPYTSGLGTSGRNTRIVLNGKTGSGVVGKKEFFYDRLNIASMFNGITVVFKANGQSATVADLLPALNEQYGLGLTAEDITNGSTKLGTGYSPTPVTLTISSASVAYTGSLSVIWTRTPAGVFPESGPGSKVMLVGSMNEGYFGLVSEAELFNAPAMLSKINEGQDVPKGTLYPSPTVKQWFKFARDGKILYIANYNHLTIPWQDLYVRGAVYETDIPESEQYPQNGVKVPQRLAMKKTESGRDWYLSPCMPRLSSSSLLAFTTANPTPDPTGDVARLYSKVIAGGGYATAEWDVQSVDGNGYWQSTVNIDNTKQAFGASMVGLQQNVYDTVTFVGGWRPVLELIDVSKVVLPLEDFIGQQSGTLRKPLFTISPDTGEILLIVSDIAWEIQGALDKPLISITPSPFLSLHEFDWALATGTQLPLVNIAPLPPVSTEQYNWQKLLRSPVLQIHAEYKEVIAVDLSTLNGNLDGFK
ncbi:virion structural protein [Erwinia phage Derbicus]|uniref:Putative virion structural protein n=2 Tax=Derbicusvirus derbicus TaxID=2734104 RepID=A0A482IL08_9CAUD|nr:virion structural protein [Erwinia phage vB_EamM_EarlPhillipIV]YP_009821192.1 virion structural protein [Erwinia phage Derbicus]ANZ48997.1 putative virion structural protein [Erwinia phage vB_EamM_EarlPhillipIV]QBP07574.1 putative virion structural protein [Erwinia phage Derbicus]